MLLKIILNHLGKGLVPALMRGANRPRRYGRGLRPPSSGEPAPDPVLNEEPSSSDGGGSDGGGAAAGGAAGAMAGGGEGM